MLIVLSKSKVQEIKKDKIMLMLNLGCCFYLSTFNLYFICKGSHSEHFEEEILCLRNTLLQVHVIQFVGCLLYKFFVS